VGGYADRPRSEKGGGDGFEGVRVARAGEGWSVLERVVRYILGAKKGVR